MYAQLFHAGLVAQNAALAAFTTGVDGKHGQFASAFQYMQAECIDGGTLSCTGHAADANTHGASGMGQAFFDYLLCDGLVLRQSAFYQGDGLAQQGSVPLQDSFHVVACAQLLALGLALELAVGIDGRRLFNTFVYSQSFVFFTVFGMFHNANVELLLTQRYVDFHFGIGGVVGDKHHTGIHLFLFQIFGRGGYFQFGMFARGQHRLL